MYRHIFFSFSLSFLLNFLSTESAGLWISDSRTPKQLDEIDTVEKNGTVSPESVSENSSSTASEEEVLFWTVPEKNETTEESVAVQMDPQEMVLEEASQLDEMETLEEKETQVKEQDSVFTEAEHVETTELVEKIVLQRMNCYLEMAVEDIHDLKIQIKFGKLQNHTSGKCCITLNGPENSMLAVLISGIHLYKNGSDGEILQVIIANHGVNFILREYYHGSKYQPLLLTETHRVYLVLHYKVTTLTPDEQDSHFDLEVLTYHKYRNQMQSNTGEYSSAFTPVKAPNLNKFYG